VSAASRLVSMLNLSERQIIQTPVNYRSQKNIETNLDATA
jgi:hypothetical protein